MSFIENGETKHYSYSPNSNRLTQIGHKEVALDAAGNTLSKDNGKWRYEYGQSGRLLKAYKEKKLVGTYLYNHLGLRTQKTTKHGMTIYHYDLNGHLIAETAKDGTLQRAYVWLNDLPLVQIDVKAHHDDKGKDKRRHRAKEHIAYLHTDHLGTPRIATDALQQIVWRWDSDAFGARKPDDLDDDHEDDGHEITVNLRFAGQYFDKETGLFYNWNRYYDPRTGRYVTSDPIGLDGGLNTFTYVWNNPLRWTDPLGLVDPGIYRRPLERDPTGIGKHWNVCDKSDECTGFFPEGPKTDTNPNAPGTLLKPLTDQQAACTKNAVLLCQNYNFFGNNCQHCVLWAGSWWPDLPKPQLPPHPDPLPPVSDSFDPL